jgi:uncharacterized protein YqeY
MNSLQERLQTDFRLSIKTNDMLTRESLKVVLGELQRQSKKVLEDVEVIQILKKLEKNELEFIKAAGCAETDYLKLLQFYLPHMVSDSDIVKWIEANVDFTSLKNKMQAVGIVMKHFGPSAEGNRVKELIQEIKLGT